MLRDCVGFAGQIISFEPNPKVLPQLQTLAARDSRWHVEPFALGMKTGKAEFNAYDLSELASFRPFSASRHAPENQSGGTVIVPVETLSCYFPRARRRWGFKHPFLKLDTQGFDIEVARGAGSFLTEFVGLQSEIAFDPIYDGAPNYVEALEFYKSAGFLLSRLAPLHEIHFPQLVEMDAIMIRSDLA